jgi:ubiquinone/menaquinone biosynthesis C-methylase UbiE
MSSEKRMGSARCMNGESKPSVVDLSGEYDRWHKHVFTAEDLDQKSPWYQLVLEYLAPLQGKMVLEVACGRGGFSLVLESRGASVYGADFSRAALRIATQKMGSDNTRRSNVALIQADVHQLPFACGTFDYVISCETIEHLTDPFTALREMARVSKPGGMLYLTTPNYLNLMGLYLIYDAILKKNRRSPTAQPLDHRWLFPRIRRIVERAGWKILRSDGIVHQVPLPGRNPLRLCFLERIPLVRRFLSPLAFHYFVLAKKRDA